MTDAQTTFEALGLSKDLLAALEKKGFTNPTPIQEKSIPILLNTDHDLIGQAQTGTGKTAAFGLPILEQLDPSQFKVQALIISPTRELSLQIKTELDWLKGRKNASVSAIYGGESFEKQFRELKRGVDIVVGTPGRLLDLTKSKKLDLSELKVLVLDEADEMLQKGFIEDIEEILSHANSERRTVLFSATMPKQILNLAKTYMTDYEHVKVEKKMSDTSLTKQYYCEVRQSDKAEVLCRLMDSEEVFYGFVFCRTKREADELNETLVRRKYDSEALHGDLSQAQRQRVLQKFRDKESAVLVVTDVASRGIDISGLTHVVNFSLPQQVESYVHRIGRTGRAGKSGTIYTLLTPSECKKLRPFQKVVNNVIEELAIPSISDVMGKKRALVFDKLLKGAQGTVKEEFVDAAKELVEKEDAILLLAKSLELSFEKAFCESDYEKIGKSRSRNKNRSDDFSERRGGRHAGSRGRDGFRNSDRRFGDKRAGGGKNKSRERGQSRQFSGDRLFIPKGKKDNLSPRELVAMLEKESKVPGNRIHQVQMMHAYSFFTVSEKDAHTIKKRLNTPNQREFVTDAKT